MNINKINPWLGGSASVLAGSLLVYFETYRNSEFIDGIAYLFILLGWITMYAEAIKGTIVSAKKILFGDDKPGWLKQRSAILLAYLILMGLLAGTYFGINQLSSDRRTNILENGANAKTTAVITGIQKRRYRGSTSYYAIFQYEVGVKVIQHPWYERNENDFLPGQRFMIQYSVDYPEMFKIVGTLDPVFKN